MAYLATCRCGKASSMERHRSVLLDALRRSTPFAAPFCAGRSSSELLSAARRPPLREICNQESCNRSEEYDVVIVGGGMVGAAVACGLASNRLTGSLRVAIVDNNPLSGTLQRTTADATPDSRVSTITPATCAFLKEVGAWEGIQHCRHAPFDSMQVWDYTGLGYTRYNAADVGKPFLGFVVENRVILSALHSRLQHLGFGKLICPVGVKAVTFPNHLSWDAKRENDARMRRSWVQIVLEDGRCLYTHLVIGADGARSKIRSMAGVEALKREYKQQAVICTIETETNHSTAWQRFLPTGPLAILPMGNTFSNVVWSTSPEQALKLRSMGDEEFVATINRALTEDFSPFPSSDIPRLLADRFGSFFGGMSPSSSEPFEVPPRIVKCLSERLSFPLFLGHAHKYIAPHLALVGDAAHTVHPLAGQGVNLGFADAASLVSVLGSGVKLGADLGEVSLLEQYERQRMFENIPMMTILDGFQRIFSLDLGPVNVARAAAFGAAQVFSPLKRRIISYAMGEGGFLKNSVVSSYVY